MHHPLSPTSPPKFMRIFLFLMPSSEILHLPISHHGFRFASISHFNDAAAVSGVIQDLNHHIPLFCNMAQITIADWQCSITKCIFPFSPEGMRFSYHLSSPSIPIFFTLAHCVLHSLKLNIVPSDQSSIMRGEISLIHLALHVPNSPHITTLRCYVHSPYQFLQAWGSWHTWGLSPSHSRFQPSVSANPFPPSVPQHYNFQTIQWWLACIDVVPLGCGPSILLTSPQSLTHAVLFLV